MVQLFHKMMMLQIGEKIKKNILKVIRQLKKHGCFIFQLTEIPTKLQKLSVFLKKNRHFIWQNCHSSAFYEILFLLLIDIGDHIDRLSIQN